MADPTNPTNPQDPTVLATETDAVNTNTAAINANIDAIKRRKDALDQSKNSTDKGTDSTDKNKDSNDKNKSSVDASTDSLNIASAAMKIYGDITNSAGNALQHFADAAGISLGKLNKQEDLTLAQSMKLGAVFQGLGAVQDPFKNIAESNNLGLFTAQFEGVIDAMDKSQLLDLAKKFGMVGASISSPEGIAAAKKFITQINTNADSFVHYEDMLVRAGAATGRLGEVNAAAGPHLENMNKYVLDQRNRLESAGAAAGLTSVQMAQFAKGMLQVPGAMKELTDEEKKSTDGLDTYNAVLALARATGMDYTDMQKDMLVAVRDYNADMPAALKFTAQIAEISEKAGVQIDDVRKALSTTAETFKYFGAGAQGAAEIMNKYVGALKDTGLSGATSSEVIGNMTNQMGKLSIAQSAFLSAQSGGPGGLQGAFHIQNLLQQKDGMQKVFEMAKNQMTKMMGPNLVSSKEAEQSPQAAAQMNKQIAILQQGPLGQFARSIPEAMHIMDMIKSGKADNVSALAENMKAPLDKGLEYQKQTATGIHEIVSELRRGSAFAGYASINAIQATSTAGSGTEFADQNEDEVQKMRAARQQYINDAARAKTDEADISLINAGIRTIKSIPNMAKAVGQGLTGVLKSEGTPGRKPEDLAQYQERANAQKAAVGVITRTGMGIPNMQGIEETELGIPIITTPGRQVGAAAGANANRKANATGTPHTPAMAQNATVTTSGNKDWGQITVHVEGICIDCGEKMKGSTQRTQVNPATR